MTGILGDCGDKVDTPSVRYRITQISTTSNVAMGAPFFSRRFCANSMSCKLQQWTVAAPVASPLASWENARLSCTFQPEAAHKQHQQSFVPRSF